MDPIDPTEQALVERIETWRQQLREAEEGLEQYRREREAERQIARDRRIALALEDMDFLGHLLRVMERNGGGADNDNDDDILDRVEIRNDNRRHCITCLDDLSDDDAHRCPCGHRWCQPCVVNRFEMASRSTRLFPAQCCNQPILPDNHELIAPETWTRYLAKRVEAETPNPTFCSRRDCSNFIPPQNIDEGQATCVCGHVTCSSCKAAWHAGECVVDPETEQLLRLAREQRWQTCFHCREMVVRRDGCNQMSMFNMTSSHEQISWEPLLIINPQDANVATFSAMHVAWSGRHVPALSLGASNFLGGFLGMLRLMRPMRLLRLLGLLGLLMLSSSTTLTLPTKKHCLGAVIRTDGDASVVEPVRAATMS